ncbi:MAG: DUF4332 domain-containing protein [Verrucomicrobiales bacterium]|nr:DUF4332 domain-containing protein [Verrucomicrobiota bacterium JB025]
MEQLVTTARIGETSLELLEAAGFNNVRAIANANADELAAELEQANQVLKISKHSPGKSMVEEWIRSAREIVVDGPAAGELQIDEDVRPADPVNYEESEEVAAMLEVAPFAIPLPARVMVHNHLAVADIPPAILLNRYSGDLDVRVEDRMPKNRQPETNPVSTSVKLANDTRNQQKLDIDVSRVKSIEEMSGPRQKVPSVKASPSNDRVALLRAPRSETNKGRNPNSRWYIRGVLHSHPVSVYVGALVTLLTMIWVPVAIIASALLLFSAEIPEKFAWVPGWILVFPVVLPLLGIAYLIWGLHGSCRICGQRLFVHRAHLKNIKAHHVKGLGYILPLCFQILIFRWFRCTHCGTPVRLKE